MKTIITVCAIILNLWNLSVVKSAAIIENNVCKTVTDYDTRITNPNCWYNSDVDLEVPAIIKKYGYPVEEHEVITQDGYILQLFRIPYGRSESSFWAKRKKQTVFLQHGIFACSAPWVVNGNDSIAFILADEGYDVWLANSRGSTYGRRHQKFSLMDSRYWKFSYHEMGIYDLPKSLDLVYKTTGRNDTIVIGQSMGTNVQLVYASEFPDHARKRVKMMIYLAPTVFVKHVKTPLVQYAQLWPAFQKLAKNVGLYELLSQSQIRKDISKITCLQSGATIFMCQSLMFVIFGFDYENFSPSMVPVVLSHYPAGGSMHEVIHLLQGAMTDTFSKYDYGFHLNKKYYNRSSPPEYNLSRINVPSYIIYGNNDWVAPEEGAIKLYDKLPLTEGLFKIRDLKYNHIDFFFAKNVRSELITHLLKVLKNFSTYE